MGLLHTADCGPVAIVGSETGSVFFDPRRASEDSGQLINLLQMGDGAAACVLARPPGACAARVSSVFHGYSGSDLEPGFSLTSGGSDVPPARVRFRNSRMTMPTFCSTVSGCLPTVWRRCGSSVLTATT